MPRGSRGSLFGLLRAVPDTTLAGRFTLAFLLIALIFAVMLRDNAVLFPVCAVWATVLVSALGTSLSLGRLEVARSIPARAIAGTPFPARLQVRNRARLRPALGISLRDALQRSAPGEVTLGAEIPVLPPGGSVELAFDAVIHARGVHEVSSTLVTTRFPFGLFERRALLRSASRIVVLPALGRLRRRAERDLEPLGQPTPSPRLVEQGGEEFHGLREFRDGDNPRHIHWRTSARTGALMRRELRDDRDAELTILLDTCIAGLAGETRRHSFERAVSCAATLVVSAAKRGYRVRLAFPGGGGVCEGGQRGVLALWETLAGVRRGEQTAESLVEATPLRPRGTALLLSLEGDAAGAVAVAARRSVRLRVWDTASLSFARLFAR
ncbi:MAG: DUF58 domain-containing protein [Planctomycetaceae bacterium]